MIGVLGGYLGNPNPVLRSHAAGLSGGSAVQWSPKVLNQALQDETDPVTEIEIESALIQLVRAKKPANRTVPINSLSAIAR